MTPPSGAAGRPGVLADRVGDDGWAADDQEAGLWVSPYGSAALAAVERHVPGLVADRIASRLGQADPTLWGGTAEPDAAAGLGWLTLADSSRALLEPIRRLHEELLAEGVDRIVLCGTGGSSLAAEVIARSAALPLVVLDSTHPDQVRDALVQLDRTAVVISGTPGTTLETESRRRVFESAFGAAGLDAASRTVVVTDPGSPLEAAARAAGHRALFTADPLVGGRFSALSAFGLVPAGLAGADVGALLDEAAAVADELTEDADSNPAIVLGAVLGGTLPLRDKLALVDIGSGMVGFADWAEQLVAGATGKRGTGLLPVPTGGPDSPEIRWPAADVLVARLAHAGGDGPSTPTGSGVQVAGPLGAQFLLWEHAVGIAGRLLGINPFDRPAVEAFEAAALARLPAGSRPAEPPDAVDGAIEIRATPGLLRRPSTASAAVSDLLSEVPPDGYVAVLAYLDRWRDGALAGVRDALARRAGRPTTFGWGPRQLHSAGQFHRGGPPTGVFLQITGAPVADVAIPGRPFGFADLIAVQAADHAQVLMGLGRPVLRLHLTDHATGLRQLIAALVDQQSPTEETTE